MKYNKYRTWRQLFLYVALKVYDLVCIIFFKTSLYLFLVFFTNSLQNANYSNGIWLYIRGLNLFLPFTNFHNQKSSVMDQDFHILKNLQLYDFPKFFCSMHPLTTPTHMHCMHTHMTPTFKLQLHGTSGTLLFFTEL